MLDFVTKRLIGTRNDRELKRMRPVVARINDLEPWAKGLTDDGLRAQVAKWKDELKAGRKVDDLLPDCFALTREASVRALGMRHFDVQLIGGMVLNKGRIAEMKTGEGKTLVATLPCVLNALEGKGVHVVTINDYLARRDAEWMGRLYRFLGLSTGVILHGLTDSERQANYGCDITYGQNNEFGFDYLRDNMKFRLADYVQRELHYAIVDEVDSILIDEARTPLIISGPSEEATDLYYTVNEKIPKLVKERDYNVDEEHQSVTLTDEGVERVEQLLGVGNLYDPDNIETLHHVEQALRAHTLYRRDEKYVVKDGEVIIVDDFTGRLMPGRRWSDGLHQAVEAKEGVKIEAENQTLATISFQNYFRMYTKLSGMTGTADTEAEEFNKIYQLEVTVIPTNKQNVRTDIEDTVYKTEREKFGAVAEELEKCHQKGQPVLVGTVSIAKSEILANLLKKRGVPHVVLNAKQHEKEAGIVAQAGRKGAITISTNMAGRGTDILLGGNPEFMARQEVGAEPDEDEIRDELVTPPPKETRPENWTTPTETQIHQWYVARHGEWQARFDAALAKFRAQCKAEHDEVVAVGGLHILGTERHESRRIDNQLRGRAGRQGDPGSSHFFLSLEDDLMRIFASERIQKLMEFLGVKDGEPIEHRMLTNAIEGAQKRVEGQNFDIRKNLLEYDDVMNQQRRTVYAMRKEVLAAGAGVPLIGFDEDPRTKKKTRWEKTVAWPDFDERVLDLLEDQIIELVENAIPKKAADWEPAALEKAIRDQFNLEFSLAGSSPDRETLELNVFNSVEKHFKKKLAPPPEGVGDEQFHRYAQWIYLNIVDTLWKDHLLQMDHLRQGIHLRGYGQKDPKLEYKKEGFDMFQLMKGRITANVVGTLMRVEPVASKAPVIEQRRAARTVESHGDAPAAAAPVQKDGPRIGRNDPCYCGSGKKYKKCHLPIDEGAQPAA